ncbi:MAG: hypothetical protein Tsb0027_05790 [Wenzhouxiangellaceae bacterium]
MYPLPTEAYRLDISEMIQYNEFNIPNQLKMVIAHTGFCASTLLSMLIDNDDLIIIREPQVLSQIANIYRIQGGNDYSSSLLRLMLSLLGRKYTIDQKSILKLSNYTNNLIEHIMEIESNTTLLTIIGSLDELMISMLLHEDEASINLKKFINAMQMDIINHPKFSRHDIDGMSILKQTVLLWSLQMTMLASLKANLSDRVYKISTSDVLDRTDFVLTKIDNLLGIERTDKERNNAIKMNKKLNAKKNRNKAEMYSSNVRDLIRINSQEERRDAKLWACDHGLYIDSDLNYIGHNLL